MHIYMVCPSELRSFRKSVERFQKSYGDKKKTGLTGWLTDRSDLVAWGINNYYQIKGDKSIFIQVQHTENFMKGT